MHSKKFIYQSEILLGLRHDESLARFEERYRAHFGITVTKTAKIWEYYHEKMTKNTYPKHLLCTLYFLRKYPTEKISCTFVKATPKIWRKLVFSTVKILARSKTVRAN